MNINLPDKPNPLNTTDTILSNLCRFTGQCKAFYNVEDRDYTVIIKCDIPGEPSSGELKLNFHKKT